MGAVLWGQIFYSQLFQPPFLWPSSRWTLCFLTQHILISLKRAWNQLCRNKKGVKDSLTMICHMGLIVAQKATLVMMFLVNSCWMSKLDSLLLRQSQYQYSQLAIWFLLLFCFFIKNSFSVVIIDTFFSVQFNGF